jgi:hypothetical protein
MSFLKCTTLLRRRVLLMIKGEQRCFDLTKVQMSGRSVELAI